jgi:hypothetical protein
MLGASRAKKRERTMTKLEKTVSAARRQLRSGNRIEAIKAVRAAYPDAGLKGAKDFVDWLEMQVLSISATAAGWCVKHWQPFNFDQPEGHYLVAHTDALNLTTALDDGMPPSLQPVKCKCGNSFCTDRWHRLARWLGEDPGNWSKLQAWLKAMWDEHPEADRTFEVAPGLSLVWSDVKIEE